MSDAPIDLEDEVRDLFKRKLEEFAAFCAADWQLSMEDHAEAFPDEGDAHRRGYNAAMREGVLNAIEFWTEPMGYT